jgi:gliding motility-associated-like protein
MLRFTLTHIFLFLLYAGYSQTVSIDSDAEVCVNELLVLKSVVSGSPIAYSWSFGDNSVSTQTNPSHTYNTAGNIAITLVVTFSGGVSVTATKNVQVNDIPQPDFSLDNSIFCFNSQQICLRDKSTMGSTTTGYTSRLILWGDGSQDFSTNPSIGDIICFGSYPKYNVPYTIRAEVKNDKGCENQWQQIINILKDYKSSFYFQVQGATCDDQVVCFFNDSSNLSNDILSFVWDFGDGTTDTSNWKNPCHKYSSTGIYSAKLTVRLKNGCTAELTRNVQVRITQFEAIAEILDSINCYPETFTIASKLVPNGVYTWSLYSEDTGFLNNVGSRVVQDIMVPNPGNYFFRLKLSVGNCTKYSRYIPIISNGIKAEFISLNKQQCDLKDTVYFVNLSEYHPTAIPSFYWDFGDNAAAKCIGYPINCDYDTLENTQHYYPNFDCYKVKLVVTDKVSGCKSEYIDSSIRLAENTRDFKFTMGKPCIGSRAGYGVNINAENCGPEIGVCVDSLANPKKFVNFSGGKIVYTQVADSNGWVTVGFALQSGQRKVYRSADTTDYYIDDTRVCKDTVWFHHWFQLHQEPLGDFDISQDRGCLPVQKTAKYLGNEESKLVLMKYLWELSGTLGIIKLYPDTIPDISHTYTQEGIETLYILLEDSFGCYTEVFFQDTFGYINRITSSTNVCANVPLNFYSDVKYYFDDTPYWEDTNRPEKLNWDFDDGKGFSDTTANPVFSFSNPGNYQIRLASSDMDGCTDTAYFEVNVNGINAAIKQPTEEYLCDQIIQFFDSSYFSYVPTSDFITEYFWDFGDNTTVSYLKDPFHYYATNGINTLTHIVTSEQGCIDTAYIDIYIKGPEPFFIITSDTVGCVPFTASFKSTSTNASAFIWRMGDSNSTTIFSHNDTTFNFTYNQPGIYYISLEASDSFYNEHSNNTYTCSAIFPAINSNQAIMRRIIVLPIPRALFTFDDPVCVGQELIFKNKSDTIYKKLNWEVDGFPQTTISDLKYVFNTAGNHVIKLLPTYEPQGPYQRACYDSFTNTFLVHYVEAKFGVEQKGICNEFFFTDSSVNASHYLWDFGHPVSRNKNVSSNPNTSHRYGTDNGEYEVCLTVTSEAGCIDSACTNLTSIYTSALQPYNVFTPNGDKLNDEFLVHIENVERFYLKIFNRWGEKVFETQDPTLGWNGLMNNTGIILPTSTYFYILTYKFNCQENEEIVEGIVDLIRE